MKRYFALAFAMAALTGSLLVTAPAANALICTRTGNTTICN